MELPELIRKSAEKLLTEYCRHGLPPATREQLRLGWAAQGETITLFAEEKTGPAETVRITHPVAQFRYNPFLGQWSLHYHSQEAGWRFYMSAGPSLNLAKLLSHVAADPLGVFWA